MDIRLKALISGIEGSKLNDEEIDMLWFVLSLSKDRNIFEEQYSLKINEIFKKRESVTNGK